MVKLRRLTPAEVSSKQDAGYFLDGAGPYLRVLTTGGKSWAFLFMKHGRSHEITLGSYLAITLGAARKLAAEARASLRAGVDLIEKRRVEREPAKRRSN